MSIEYGSRICNSLECTEGMRISTGSFQTGMEDILATFTNIITTITAGSFESSMKHNLSLHQDLVFLKQTIFGV